jgi:uncharacterized membrane protein YphA (DoxX/SURF4 family)
LSKIWWLRLLLGGVFLYAGIAKVRDPQDFADAVASFRLLPADVINPFALGLPPYEILLGAWLLSGWRLRTAAFGASATMLVFLAALALAKIRGLTVNCGCFGGGGAPGNSGLALARDVGLALAALALYASSGLRPRAA